jgi:hypothetical protein
MEMLRGMLLVGLVGMTVTCTLFADKYGPLAEHLHSPEGFAEWKQNEQVLRQAADAAMARYRQEELMEALRVCETESESISITGFSCSGPIGPPVLIFRQGLKIRCRRARTTLWMWRTGILNKGVRL